MTEYDRMKLFSQFEEYDEGDFTPEEMEEYFAYAQGTERPLSPKEWKEKYFDFYDDVKEKTRKKQDW